MVESLKKVVDAAALCQLLIRLLDKNPDAKASEIILMAKKEWESPKSSNAA